MKRELSREEALTFFSHFFHGEHHIPGGPKGVKEFGPGWCVNTRSDLSTYDFDALTRLVFLAHDYCYRASVMCSGPGMVKIAIWKREPNGQHFYDYHPTIEGALAKWRKDNPVREATAS